MHPTVALVAPANLPEHEGVNVKYAHAAVQFENTSKSRLLDGRECQNTLNCRINLKYGNLSSAFPTFSARGRKLSTFLWVSIVHIFGRAIATLLLRSAHRENRDVS